MAAEDPYADARDEKLREREEAERPLREAGGGEAEGFEQAEEELIEHASHGDERSTNAVLRDEMDEAEDESSRRADGEPDHEHSSEVESDEDDR
jgi:hypothetical protein